MHSSLIAVVLCIFAQAAAAECVATAPLARDARTGAEVIKSVAATAPVRAGGELIKTAAAGTRDATGQREATAIVRDTAAAPSGEDNPRRSGAAMLLAALAVMSGIALRRYDAHKQ